MPFSTRVFCGEPTTPSVSEMLVWMRQFDAPLTVTGGQSQDDLLSTFWDDVLLSYDPAEAPLHVQCFRADAAGVARFRSEVADFVADVEELPPSAGRERVLAQLAAARAVVVIELPAEGISPRGDTVNGWLMSLFVERAAGMVQIDGIGFFDEDDDVILPLG